MTAPTVTTAPLFDIYRTAVTIRKSDDRFTSMLTSGEIAMTYYSPMGQEVISASMAAVSGDDDYVVTTYRGLHDHIAAGVPLDLLWAEFLGKATGTCKGKGGPMHITHPDSGLMVTTGIVGSGLPIANGLALSSLMRGDGRVTVVNFGDGSTNIGAFHEAMNLASLWDLPVVFVCQNNQYGEKTSFRHHTKVTCIADRATSYAMPSVTVNGNDASEMWAAARDAVDRARSGGGPTLLEAMTFRFRGHTFGDDQAYIPAEQMAAARDRDPVPLLRSQLIESGQATEDEVAVAEAELDAELDKAVEFALASPLPDPVEITRDVYAQEGTR